MYYAVDELDDNLQHHGIKGMRWGVRRFQNADGSLTAAGKKRYDWDSDDAQNAGGSRKTINKSAITKGAAVAGLVAGAAVLAASPAARQTLAKYGKVAISSLPGAANKVGHTVGKGAVTIGKKVGDRASKVGDAMIDAALMSVGGIAIAKVTDKLAVGDDATEAQKNRSKILTDTVTAGIREATKASGGSSGNGNKGGKVGSDVTNALGAPSKKGIDKQSKDYQDLFKGIDNPEVRGTIKSLAAQGYDIDQLKKYKDEFGHSDFNDWVSQYMAVEMGW